MDEPTRNSILDHEGLTRDAVWFAIVSRFEELRREQPKAGEVMR
ncbi:MAG: hypothetical protein ACE5JZ_07820 [Kiloniellales bacterium]